MKRKRIKPGRPRMPSLNGVQLTEVELWLIDVRSMFSEAVDTTRQQLDIQATDGLQRQLAYNKNAVQAIDFTLDQLHREMQRHRKIGTHGTDASDQPAGCG